VYRFATMVAAGAIAAGLVPATARAAGDIRVEAGEPAGSLTTTLAPNIWYASRAGIRHRYYGYRYVRDMVPRIVHWTLSYDVFLAGTRGPQEVLDRLRRRIGDAETPEGRLVAAARSHGFRMVVGFDPYGMPPWLSSRPGDERPAFTNEPWWPIERVVPPRDYEAWGQLVRGTLRLLREEGGLEHLGFYVGHEPETQWLGDEESLFRYYATAWRAAKALDPEIAVGGLGSFDPFRGRKAGCEDPHFTPVVQALCRAQGGWADPRGELLSRNFLAYAREHQVEPDFLNWHSFGLVPPARFGDAARVLRRWAAEYGQGDLVLYPADWTYWSGPYPADYLDTEEMAAYLGASVLAMHRAGIAWHGHDFNIEVSRFEAAVLQQRPRTQFIGDWPLLTRSGVVKASYNALRLFDLLRRPGDGAAAERQVYRVDTGRGDVDGIAVGDGTSLAVLLVRFNPLGPRRLRAAEGAYLHRLGVDPAVWAQAVLCMRRQRGDPAAVRACLEGQGVDETIRQGLERLMVLRLCLRQGRGMKACAREARSGDSPPPVRAALEAVMAAMGPTPQTERLRLVLVTDPAAWRKEGRLYRVDGSHANACRANKATEPQPTPYPCGVGGRVDRAVARLIDDLRRDGEVLRAGEGMRLTAEGRRRMFAGLDRVNDSPGVGLHPQAVALEGDPEGLAMPVEIEPNAVLLLRLDRAGKAEG